jgi:hypothetical protein
MAGGDRYRTLAFTRRCLETFASRDFSASERARFLRALGLLDTNERPPSLRVHELRGPLAGVGSASASDVLRMTFERLPDGTKAMLTCSRHYDR